MSCAALTEKLQPAGREDSSPWTKMTVTRAEVTRSNGVKQHQNSMSRRLELLMPLHEFLCDITRKLLERIGK
jgi:hypothetical protein